ncbi:transcriptional regulator, partial [Candidatus Endoriftia persephone str. Guaymas]|nr:transcriptional regulator [Candidatus Endoriftia persephone str. Guaymas]
DRKAVKEVSERQEQEEEGPSIAISSLTEASNPASA